MKEMEEIVGAAKTTNPSILPYKVATISNYPGYCVIGYMTPTNKFVHEFVKVKNTGYTFHDLEFPNFVDLLDYMKTNYRTMEYRKEVRKAKRPK